MVLIKNCFWQKVYSTKKRKKGNSVFVATGLLQYNQLNTWRNFHACPVSGDLQFSSHYLTQTINVIEHEVHILGLHLFEKMSEVEHKLQQYKRTKYIKVHKIKVMVCLINSKDVKEQTDPQLQERWMVNVIFKHILPPGKKKTDFCIYVYKLF